MTKSFSDLNPKEFILIKGARLHNLKNIDVAIPRNKMVVITGLSGSGKSSLAFDTLYAEGQRRYVESLSSYARQFLGRINKPEVEYIKGISPAVAIEQKVISKNPRSTVGTTTEIYDYLKLLFARIGKTISPVSGKIVKRHTVTNVVDFITALPDQSKVFVTSPLLIQKGEKAERKLSLLLQQGFVRIIVKDEFLKIEELLADTKALKNLDKKPAPAIHLVIDRLVVNLRDPDLVARISDSVQTSFFEGNGTCKIVWNNDKENGEALFSNRFEEDGIQFEEPSVHFFAFNNPVGACRKCDGFGTTIGIDEGLVIPDKSLSVYEGAVVCWKGETMKEWKEKFIRAASKFDFPIHRAYSDLTDAERDLLWKGNAKIEGLDAFFTFLESQTYKIQYRVMLSRYRGKTSCPDCKGTRIRKDALYVKVGGKNIGEIISMPVSEALHFFDHIEIGDHEKKISERLLKEISNRLRYLDQVGLGYLTLSRMSSTLSGGESQRINLATSLGSSLVGSMYILDEPSIGLHPRDTERLIEVLKSLKDLGNTVIIVEHDEEVMRAADQIIDIGPYSGTHGGKLVFQGNWEKILQEENSLTARYLTGKDEIPIPSQRRKWKEFIEINGARENNLKGFSVKFPLHIFTVVTGVSGSGKTSLVKKILYPSIKKLHDGYAEQTGSFDRLNGSYRLIEGVEMIDQNPIGKSSRSNPVTYIKAWDEIRQLMCEQPQAKAKGLKPTVFSFNVDGGRCDMCQGEGEVTIEMQFMADIKLECEACGGKRFKQEILDIEYNGKNVHDILSMTIEEAITFFSQKDQAKGMESKIIHKLQPLMDVGLGYVQLGQSSSTLSGGEAQRIKLASFLVKGNTEKKTLFIFDEPTTGLHFHDIKKLLYAFNALIDQGHSLVVIEHNQEVIKCADWIIDLGPEGGKNGGSVIFEGTPEEIIKSKSSYTGKYLKPKMTGVQ